MNKLTFLTLTVILILTLTSAVSAVEIDNTTVPGLNATRDIDWAFNESQNQDKNLLMVFDQESCVYCDLLDENTLSDSEVQKELNENYIVLFVDVNEHYDVAGQYSVYGTPLIQILNPDGDNIARIEGYVESDRFLEDLQEL